MWQHILIQIVSMKGGKNNEKHIQFNVCLIFEIESGFVLHYHCITATVHKRIYVVDQDSTGAVATYVCSHDYSF